MKFLKQFIIMIVASCVLAVGAMAVEPQKNDQKPPPPKEKQDVPKPDKTPPPPPRNDNGNRGGNEGKKGKP
jgi:hypothetical protein